MEEKNREYDKKKKSNQISAQIEPGYFEGKKSLSSPSQNLQV